MLNNLVDKIVELELKLNATKIAKEEYFGTSQINIMEISSELSECKAEIQHLNSIISKKDDAIDKLNADQAVAIAKAKDLLETAYSEKDKVSNL